MNAINKYSTGLAISLPLKLDVDSSPLIRALDCYLLESNGSESIFMIVGFAVAGYHNLPGSGKRMKENI